MARKSRRVRTTVYLDFVELELLRRELDRRDMTFSRWLRSKVQEELKQEGEV